MDALLRRGDSRAVAEAEAGVVLARDERVGRARLDRPGGLQAAAPIEV